MPLSLECTLKSPRPKKLLNLVQHVSVESSKIRWELLEIPPPWNSISSKCRHGSFWVDSHNNIFCAQKVGRQIWAYLWLSAIEFVMRNISLKIFCWRERHFCWEQKCFPTWGQQRSNHNMSLVGGSYIHESSNVIIHRGFFFAFSKIPCVSLASILCARNLHYAISRRISENEKESGEFWDLKRKP